MQVKANIETLRAAVAANGCELVRVNPGRKDGLYDLSFEVGEKPQEAEQALRAALAAAKIECDEISLFSAVPSCALVVRGARVEQAPAKGK